MTAKKKSPVTPKPKSQAKLPATTGSPVHLTLTLVPLVVGLILIGAWVLDIAWFEDPQSQIFVGIMFLLISFTASNVLQKRWRLAAGWAMLLAADLVLLAWLQVWAQVLALAVGLVGSGFLAVEFYHQYRQNQKKA